MVEDQPGESSFSLDDDTSGHGAAR
jgi:hypothetical protein